MYILQWKKACLELLWCNLISFQELTFFQKNPFFLFHLHLTRLLPIAALPSSQICMHVAPLQVTSFTPAGISRAGHKFQVAAALIPTGWPHFDLDWATAVNACQYTRYHEMPQKACERGFRHVIALSQFSESDRKNGAFQKNRT